MTLSLDRLISQASQLKNCPAWSSLTALAASDARPQLAALLDQPGRFAEFSRQQDGLLLDFSRQHLTGEILEVLIQLAHERHLGNWIAQLFDGANVNNTEGRPALHMALRQPAGPVQSIVRDDVIGAVEAELDHAMVFAEDVRAGRHAGATGQPITDVVNIGIGGSDLGVVMADAALRHQGDGRIKAHFVSNIDGSQLSDVLEAVPPETTLFIICSKSFTTLETRLNADAARHWLVDRLSPDAVRRHFVAVSVNDAAMDRFGISSEHRFRMWDWVGGRYSLWSAVGLCLAIVQGEAQFRSLLSGAAAMDEHFRVTPLHNNLPALLGLIGVWNQNFLGASSHVILPYDQRLLHFPAFLQQLDMESNGKCVTRDGQVVATGTGTVVWGQPGSNAQHSFFQLLHQGTADVSMDFIATARGSSRFVDMHQQGLANMLAQAEAFARGYESEDPHKTHPGDRAATILLLRALDARMLGALIALYEHKVFVQSVIWGINPFDQWGVELGKRMAADIADRLLSDVPDESLPGLANVVKEWRTD